ncbi:MAG: hypothetical protein AAF637_07660 [Pseudomonadota bacterium]
MSKASPRILGLMSLLLVASCDHIPYYNESLDWFSWSKYDPEVNAIVAEIPPPGELEAGPGAMSGSGAGINDPATGADPVSGVTGSTGSASIGTTATGGSTATVGAGTATVATGNPGGSGSSAPLVGIRNSVDGSVTWRSTRGTP